MSAIIHRCPHCGASHYTVSYSTTTCLGWEKVYQDGVLISQDPNTTTHHCTCLECMKAFTFTEGGIKTGAIADAAIDESTNSAGDSGWHYSYVASDNGTITTSISDGLTIVDAAPLKIDDNGEIFITGTTIVPIETNYDRITSLPPRDFAEWLLYGFENLKNYSRIDTLDRLTEWLKKEVEDNG